MHWFAQWMKDGCKYTMMKELVLEKKQATIQNYISGTLKFSVTIVFIMSMKSRDITKFMHIVNQNV
jgi:hypothetical protein